MLLVRVFLLSLPLNIVDSSQDWTLFKKLDVTNWKSLSSQQYVFQYDNVTVMECIFHCMDQPNCQTICLNQNTCFGNSNLMPDASKRLDVQVYVKQPINNELSSQTNYFVGATDEDIEGSWNWVDGNGNNYFNFQPGQPNNNDLNYGQFPANCGAYRVITGLLVDEYCLQNKPCIHM